MEAAGGRRDEVVRLDGVTKRFGRLVALDDVSFTIDRGEVFGYLGPNGSGKSTTIRVLLDLLRPTSGVVRVLGVDPRTSGARERRRVGYLPGDLVAWPRMSAREVVRRVASVRGVAVGRSVDALAERFQLDLDRPVGTLSKGNRQKVGVVLAFHHDPELIVLDEPSSGLDPLMQLELQRLLRERAEAGASVLVSSHVMSEIEHVADRVAIIHQGRLKVLDTVSALRARQPQRLRATFPNPVRGDAFAGLPVKVQELEEHGCTALLELDKGAPLQGVLARIAQLGAVGIEARQGTLEDAFIAELGADR